MRHIVRKIAPRLEGELPRRLLPILLAESWRQFSARSNAWLHGFSDGVLPLGSSVAGTRTLSVGRNFRASGPVWIDAIGSFKGKRYAPTLAIGDRARLQPGVHIAAIQHVTLGDDCLLGSRVLVTDHSHGSYRSDGDDPFATTPEGRDLVSSGPVTIGDRCWLGDNVVVLPNTRLGAGCVVGANSVVRGTFAPGSLIVGSPARAVRRFNQETGSWERIDDLDGTDV